MNDEKEIFKMVPISKRGTQYFNVHMPSFFSDNTTLKFVAGRLQIADFSTTKEAFGYSVFFNSWSFWSRQRENLTFISEQHCVSVTRQASTLPSELSFLYKVLGFESSVNKPPNVLY